MSDKKYEANMGGYSFVMTDNGTIEVWQDTGGDYPESYIYVKPGSVKSEKDFHYEIMAWYSNNVG